MCWLYKKLPSEIEKEDGLRMEQMFMLSIKKMKNRVGVNGIN